MNELKNITGEQGLRKARKPSVVPTLDMGKLPPQAIDLEEAVLGALMLEKEALNDVIDILSPKSFYKETHQKIFSAIIDLFKKSQPVDILTVTEELKKRGDLDIVGGPYYISQLTSRVASSANVEFHARIISQKYIMRELIRISSETIRDAYDDTTDIFDLLDRAEKELYSIAEGNIRKDYEKMSGLIANTIKSLEKLAQQKDGLSGIPSGFTALDRVTSGFQPSDLIILAARPGMGKTAFVLSLARNAAVDHKKPVAVFSLEMSAEQLVKRLIASETGIESQKLKTGKLEQHEWQQLHSRIARLSEAKLFIDDTAALSVFELRAKCRRLKAEHNIEMIVIDYLQLMTIGGETKGAGTREQEISTISRSIKGIAKELNVPIIALSQLSRASETRSGTKRPQLSDLRDSGAIEQDADIVMFIYRPEYHGFDKDTSGNAYTHGHTDIIIAKHRNGALDDIPLKFIDRFAKFTDLDFNDMDYSLPPMPGHESRFEDETDGSSFTLPSKMNDSDNEEQRDTPF